MYTRTHLNLAAAFLIGSLGLASARDLDPNLRQYVIASCTQDAYRLCPRSLGSERDAVACMSGKRTQLNQACRTAYEMAVRVLAQ